MTGPPAIPAAAVAGLTTLTALYLLVSFHWLARKRPDYSHVRQTISELGEAGSPVAGATAWLSFAPTGVLFCLSLWALRPYLPNGGDVTQGLLFFAAVGAGYILAAIFPCDAGAPFFGSVRNLIHNLSGAIEYLGALGGLDILRRSLEDSARWSFLATAAQVAFVMVLIAFIGTAFTHPWRGLLQRVGEGAIFGWLVLAGWSVARLA